MNRRNQMLRTFSMQAWAMHPRYLAALCSRAMAGLDDVRPIGDDAATAEPEREVGVLVIPIRGTIVHHQSDAYYEYGIVTVADHLVYALDRAEADDSVTGVVLDIDSGGGMAGGTPEAAERIYRFRQAKPIEAVANSFTASAAFYWGAAAGKFYVTPSGEVGSIGTLMIHQDITAMLEQLGVKIEILRADQAENKARMNPFEPLTEEERAVATAQLNTVNNRFLSDVERYRGMAPGTLADLSQLGRTFLAEEAARIGLVDGVRTLAEVVASMEASSTEDDEFGAPIEDDRSAPVRVLPEGAELRSLEDMEVRAAGENAAHLDGVALRYGSRSLDLGGFVEEFADGAFTGSLAGADLRVLWQHDGRYVFGRVRAGTATIWDEGGELRYQATPPDAQWARDAMESIRRGDVTCNSFAFRVEKGGEKWERRGGELVRTVTKARLIECGPQTSPAYTDTSVAVRGMEAFRIEERRASKKAEHERKVMAAEMVV